MELSFVVAAIKRRPWIIVLFMGLGLLPAFLGGSSTPTYEATAVLLVSPPAQGPTGQANTSDRYVANQLSTLRDTGLAERVANSIDGDITTTYVKDSVQITQRAGTDLVEVTATSEDPELAQNIADLYVTTYIQDLRDRTAEAQNPDLQAVDTALADIKAELVRVDGQIALAIAPYLPQPGASPNSAVAPPAPESLVPDLVTQRNLLIEEYNRQLDNRGQVGELAALRVTSEVVQGATLPTIPITESNKLMVVAGVFAGMVLGVLVTAVAAATSKRVLDGSHAEEILQTPVVGKLAKDRSLARHPLNALTNLPQGSVGIIDQLCVRAEAQARESRGLTVAVVGTQHRSGASMLALAMAGQFSRNGSSVTLVDADFRNQDLTHLLSAPAGKDIPTLLARGNALESAETRATQLRGLNPYEPIDISDVHFVGAGSKAANTTYRRHHISTILDTAARDFDVVVIDGGSVLDAASTVQLCTLVDAIVLAVPVSHQDASALEVVTRQLGTRRGELLPVVTSPPRQRPFSHHRAAHEVETEREPSATVTVESSTAPDRTRERATQPTTTTPAPQRATVSTPLRTAESTQPRAERPPSWTTEAATPRSTTRPVETRPPAEDIVAIASPTPGGPTTGPSTGSTGGPTSGPTSGTGSGSAGGTGSSSGSGRRTSKDGAKPPTSAERRANANGDRRTTPRGSSQGKRPAGSSASTGSSAARERNTANGAEASFEPERSSNGILEVSVSREPNDR